MSRKMALMGSTVGDEWDDKAHDNVTKIQVSHDFMGINFVKFEYVDGTETVTGAEYAHGRIRKSSQTEEFELTPDEYITEVEVHSDYIGPVGQIMMLKFKTNKRTSKAYGHENEKFLHSLKKKVFAEKNKKIVGFHGKYGERILHDFSVYVSPINKASTLKQLFYGYLDQIKNKFV